MTPTEDLQRVLDMAEAVMLKVTPGDLDKPTQCTEWDVRALANHMTGVNFLFGRAAGGEAITERPAPTDLIGNDPGDAYKRSAAASSAGWNAPGALERTLTIPAGQLPGNVAIGINTVDQLLHTCDLARALGHDLTVPDDLAETAMKYLQMLMSPERRGPGKPFGEEIAVPADAPIQQRILAFSGRQP
ncbi:MAG TPA: TIGR03086 family metal-binding protein [Chloroflexota bacterium]|nr:TIGR03086 family metal-binding protein [Chloroflexota bacterium]